MRRSPLRPWALTALIGLVYLVVAPPTTDLAAQAHRTALAERGVWIVDFSWFGGHHLPSYSVLSPLLGVRLGTLVVGVLSAIVAAWAFERLVRRAWGGAPEGAPAGPEPTPATAAPAPERSARSETEAERTGRAATGVTVAAWWFAGGIGALLFTGRVTFLLGFAIGLVTLLSLTARPGRTVAPAIGATVGAALTALASPVAALFLALVGAAVAAGHAPRTTRLLAALTAGVAFAASCVLALAFPGGGSEPFVPSALIPAVVALVVALAVVPSEQRGLRVGVALYLVGVVLAGTLATPMGGNATRLAAAVGGPLLVAALWGRRRPIVVAALAVPLLYWQLYPPVRDATQAWSDDSARASYWRPADRTLRALVATEPGRVDVPPTARRGEARWISPEVPLVRGWIRQLDRDRGALFYGDGPHRSAAISGPAYRAWLDDHAVRWVALPDAEPDYASRHVVALLRDGRVPGLRRVWSAPHWTIWRVEGARPLVAPEAGGATSVRVEAADADAIRIVGARPGVPLRLRVRWSPYLRVTSGHACLDEAEDGWTRVIPTATGTVSVSSGLPIPWRRSPPVACAS